MHVVKAQFVDIIESEGARVYTFRASSSSVDRQNEIVDQNGWQLDSYRVGIWHENHGKDLAVVERIA